VATGRRKPSDGLKRRIPLAYGSACQQLFVNAGFTPFAHDFARGELQFVSPRVVTPAQHLKIVK